MKIKFKTKSTMGSHTNLWTLIYNIEHHVEEYYMENILPNKRSIAYRYINIADSRWSYYEPYIARRFGINKHELLE